MFISLCNVALNYNRCALYFLFISLYLSNGLIYLHFKCILNKKVSTVGINVGINKKNLSYSIYSYYIYQHVLTYYVIPL